MSVTVVGLVATFGMNFNVLTPPLAAGRAAQRRVRLWLPDDRVGDRRPDAAAVALVLSGKPRPWRIGGGAILLGVATLALSASTSYPLSLLLMVPVGFGGIFDGRDRERDDPAQPPDGLRGRVMSVYTTVFSASVPIGGIATGVMASTIGVQATMAIGGGLSLLTGIVAAVWWRRISAAAQGRVASEPRWGCNPAPPDANLYVNVKVWYHHHRCPSLIPRSTHAVAGETRDDYRWIVLAVTSVGALLASLTSGTLVIALPDILRDLQTDLFSLLWIVVGLHAGRDRPGAQRRSHRRPRGPSPLVHDRLRDLHGGLGRLRARARRPDPRSSPGSSRASAGPS